jgi:hypothetical protein
MYLDTVILFWDGGIECKILILIIKEDKSRTRMWDLQIEMPQCYHCSITSYDESA